MTPTPKYDKQRQYQRVLFHKTLQNSKTMGAWVVWESGDKQPLLDLSFNGMSVAKPENMDLKACAHHKIKLAFKSSEECELNLEIMWVGSHSVGAYFKELTPEARVVIDHNLEVGLVGQSLNLIDKKFYKKDLDCDLWFQGSEGTSIRIWLLPESEAIQGMHFSREQGMISLEDGKLTIKTSGHQDEISIKANESGTATLSLEGSQYLRQFLLIISQLTPMVPGANHLLESILNQQQGL